MENELIAVGGLAGAGLVAVIVEVIKRTFGEGIVRPRFIPLLAILVGIGLNVLIKLDAVPTESTSWVNTSFLGVLAGLSASGLYSFGKNVVNGE